MDRGPWYDVNVVVCSANDAHYDRYHGRPGVVKRVRRLAPNQLGVFVYLVGLDATVQFELRHLFDERLVSSIPNGCTKLLNTFIERGCRCKWLIHCQSVTTSFALTPLWTLCIQDDLPGLAL